MSDATRVETLPRGDLERLQLERLRALVAHAGRVPLHRDRLAAASVTPDRMRAKLVVPGGRWAATNRAFESGLKASAPFVGPTEA